MARKSPKKSASKTDSKRKALTARKTPAQSRAKASAKTLKKSAKPKTSTTKPSAADLMAHMGRSIAAIIQCRATGDGQLSNRTRSLSTACSICG